VNLLPYPYRVPLSAPYWNSATYRGILRSLLSRSVIHGPDVKKLVSSLIRELGVEEALLFSSGSFALEIALRACGVRARDEVVIPTFCCTAVVPPVLAAGAIPVLADVGEELNLTVENVERVLTDRTRAIIVPHLFGNPADIDAIIGLASGRDIRVIDDAAQALGATIDGRPVGGFGDAGILSFGREKICSGLGGGVAVSRHQGLLARPGIEFFTPRLSLVLEDLLSTLFWQKWRRWTFPAEAFFSSMKAGPDSPPALYPKVTMANLNASVALSLMQTLGENIAARRARVLAYRELLGRENRLELIPHRSGSACLTQVVRLMAKGGGDPASRIIGELTAAGYEIQGSYVPIHLLPSYQSWGRGSLPHAERVWADLVELPCEPDVSLEDVERIVFIVKQVLNT